MIEQFGQWNLNVIKELMDKLADTGLGSLTIKDGDFAVMIEAKKQAGAEPSFAAGTVPNPAEPAKAPSAPAKTAAPAAAQNVSPASPQEMQGNVVKSPIVGTFYAAPAPDQPPYVQVGSQVKKGDVLFVIESMKLMNEIQSEYSGRVKEILVENAQGVEYNQPIMVIDN